MTHTITNVFLPRRANNTHRTINICAAVNPQGINDCGHQMQLIQFISSTFEYPFQPFFLSRIHTYNFNSIPLHLHCEFDPVSSALVFLEISLFMHG